MNTSALRVVGGRALRGEIRVQRAKKRHLGDDCGIARR